MKSPRDTHSDTSNRALTPYYVPETVFSTLGMLSTYPSQHPFEVAAIFRILQVRNVMLRGVKSFVQQVRRVGYNLLFLALSRCILTALKGRWLRTGPVTRMGEKVWVSWLRTSWVNAVMYCSLSKKEREVYMTKGCVSRGNRTLAPGDLPCLDPAALDLIKDWWSAVVRRDSGLDFLGYIPALPLTSRVDLGKLLDLSGL